MKLFWFFLILFLVLRAYANVMVTSNVSERTFKLRGMFEMNCLFLSEDFKFQVSTKVLTSCPRSTPLARNAKFQPMYPLLEGVTVRWFGHSNKVLMNGRSKCLSVLVFPPSKECFQFRKQKEITWGKVWGIRGVRQNSYFSFIKNAVTIAEVWAGALSCRRRTCLKPVIILFQFLQYYVFVVLSGDAFALFHWHFYCNSFTREEDYIQNLLCTQRTFGSYWAFAVFSGPDLIANLSDGLKIMDPGFITCDDIGKLLFIIFWKHLKQLFGHFNPLPFLLVSQQMWHPSSRNLSDFQMLLQIKANRW